LDDVSVAIMTNDVSKKGSELEPYMVLAAWHHTFLSSRGFWMVLIWLIWAKISQNLHVKKEIQPLAQVPPYLMEFVF